MIGRIVTLADRYEAWRHRNEIERCAYCIGVVRRRDMVNGCCSERCAVAWAATED